MYKCEKCGNIYDYNGKTWGQPGYDPENGDGMVGNCPDCGSDDYIEVESCRVCGDYVSSNSYFKMCEDCEAKVRKEVKKKLYDFCKDLEDYEFDILEHIVSEVELQYVIREIKKEEDIKNA